jgi:SRSO17 transposase
VWAAGRFQRLVTAINEATGEVKYFLTNARTARLGRIVRVAFCRWHVEHAFRVAKSEAGLMHYEGRDYTGLMRHLVLGLVVLGFVAVHTERLRGEKPAPDDGAGVPGAEPAVPGAVPPAAWGPGDPAHQRRAPIPSVA